MPRVILIGDSIRMAYEPGVRDRLAARAEVWGPDENGGDSANVLANLDEWAIDRDADVLHLNCGLHDIKRPFGSDERRVPLEAYRANLRTIFRRLAEETSARLIWAATTPVDHERHHRRKDFDRFEEDVAAVNAASLALAAEYGLTINDLHGAVARAGPDRLLAEDGVHFTAEGVEVLAAAVAEKIADALNQS